MSKGPRLPMLGEKDKKRNSVDMLKYPVVKTYQKVRDIPGFFEGQVDLFLHPLRNPDAEIRKMETLMDRAKTRFDGEDERMADAKAKKKPVEFFREGNVSLSVWPNQGVKGEFNTFSITRSYKKGDEWKYSTSFGTNDLPKVKVVLEKAMEKYHS